MKNLCCIVNGLWPCGYCEDILCSDCYTYGHFLCGFCKKREVDNEWYKEEDRINYMREKERILKSI